MSSHRLVIKDAFWQILGRIISAFLGFIVVKIISPYLGPLRYGDYQTILKFFAFFTAFVDFGMYVIAVKDLGKIKEKNNNKELLENKFGKYVGTRLLISLAIYPIALLLGELLPAYSSNVYLIYGLPLGMIFSASFMLAGIIQLPLQINWKMEKLSFGLIFARIVQIIILLTSVFIIFPDIKFDGSKFSILAFAMILISVISSGLTQGFYVRKKSQKYLKLKIKFDKQFTINIIKKNWKYGFSYFLSSFHTLLVLIFLSNFFPTKDGYEFAGIWALGLVVIEIFLIVPSALGNSLLHKVGNYNLSQIKKSFGNLMTLITWIGGLIFTNLLIFRKELVLFIGSENFLGINFSNPGTNQILPFLGIVLLFSFIKQVFNYIFVSTNLQNKLLRINLIGIIIGGGIGLYLVPNFDIIGGIITQIILEILFVTGAIFIAYKKNVLPKLKIKNILISFLIISLFSVLGYKYINLGEYNIFKFLSIGLGFNLIIVGISYKLLKKTAKGLTNDII